MTIYSISYNVAPSIKKTKHRSTLWWEPWGITYLSRTSGKFIHVLASCDQLDYCLHWTEWIKSSPCSAHALPFHMNVSMMSCWRHMSSRCLNDTMWHWWCTKKNLVTCLDTVLKHATCLEVSTKSPDTQLFKKITPQPTHTSKMTL